MTSMLIPRKIRILETSNMFYFQNINDSKVSASSRWSFGPNSAWGSIDTTTIGKTDSTLAGYYENFTPFKNQSQRLRAQYKDFLDTLEVLVQPLMRFYFTVS